MAWRAPTELDYREWLLEGRRIGVFSRGSQWWIGDWLLYGVGKWGERYAAASRATGYDAKSLRNYRYVASRVSLSLRKDNLTFGHHALVASLDADGQRCWLERAVHDRLSVEDLRMELRVGRDEARQEPLRSLPVATRVATISCPSCGKPVPLPAEVLA